MDAKIYSPGDYRAAASPLQTIRRGSRLIVIGPPVRVVATSPDGTEILLADCWTDDVDGPTAAANAALFAAAPKLLRLAERLVIWALVNARSIQDGTLQDLVVETSAAINRAHGVL